MEYNIDDLFKLLLEKPDSDLNENKLDINIISNENVEILYVIILKYYIEVEKESVRKIKTKIPYKGKKASNKGGIKFLLSELPEKLRSMISNFLKMISSK